MNLALAVEAAVGVDHETTTEDKVEAVIISAPHTVATDDKAGETTEDSETTETVATAEKADETTEDSKTTETVATAEKADETTEDSETTETVATDDRADETTEDSETTETVATDDRADETVVAKATTVHRRELATKWTTSAKRFRQRLPSSKGEAIGPCPQPTTA
jgi:hypothetical protein